MTKKSVDDSEEVLRRLKEREQQHPVGPDAEETLRLVKAFREIKDADAKRAIVELAETFARLSK
jgi:hypothetical protein